MYSQINVHKVILIKNNNKNISPKNKNNNNKNKLPHLKNPAIIYEYMT